MSTATTTRRIKLTGISAPARGVVLAELLANASAPVLLVVAPETKVAEQLVEDVAFFAHALGAVAAPEVLLLPESMPESRDMREAFTASADRLTVLSRLRATRRTTAAAVNPKVGAIVVVTTPAALLQPVPALDDFAAHEFTLTRGQTHPFQGLLETLRELDYDSEAVCEAPGSYAIRGGIIDVYPTTATEPYRLDFFGDELEEIRAFDPVTQRSGASVDSITLSASPRLHLDPAKTGLADYLSAATRLVLVEPALLDEELSQLAREGAARSGAGGAELGADRAIHATLAAILQRVATIVAVQDIDQSSAIFNEDAETAEVTWDTESLQHHRRYPGDELVAQERLHAEAESRLDFLRRVAAWQREGFAVAFVMSKEGEEQRATEILAEEPGLGKLKPVFLRGTLNEGFRITFGRENETRSMGVPPMDRTPHGLDIAGTGALEP
ncbi:MAG TPA: transcription-repair coupling factor, partial [Candidatus Synoicihabitans sp.]|nr:transcription-repair coupling factor [Candidatus Synoicihabitans sp.]